MGVPLLADTGGGGVLGVMVAATTEPGKIFTDDQQDLFWDIANLAASAIDKLQLFDKTQQRARQLSAINEISSQLGVRTGQRGPPAPPDHRKRGAEFSTPKREACCWWTKKAAT